MTWQCLWLCTPLLLLEGGSNMVVSVQAEKLTQGLGEGLSEDVQVQG